VVALRDDTNEAIWSGDAADAFRDRIDKLPIRLEKLHNSFDKASDGLGVYGRTLEELQTDARAALVRYQNAKADERQARAEQSAWQPPPPELDPVSGAALPAVGPPPANPHDAALSSASSALQSALDDIEDVRSRRKRAGETCVGALDEAGSVGERNDSAWKKFLATASSVLKVIGVVLLVIAVIAVVVLSGGTFAGFLVACGTVFGSALGTAMTVVGAAALAVDTTRRVRGDEGAPSWKSLAFDAALTVGPGAIAKGAKYLSGADDAVRAASGADDALRVVGGADDAGRGLSGVDDAGRAVNGTDDAVGGADDVVDVVDTRPYLDPKNRPSYRKGVVEDVYERARGVDGQVRDPNTGDILDWTPGDPRKGVWDMGHVPGQKYADMHARYLDGDLTPAEFRDWYNDVEHYVPELPSNNRSHLYE
jgi:uncharacterized protein YukE